MFAITKNNKYDVLTKDGFRVFGGIKRVMEKQTIYTVYFKEKNKIKCTDGHVFEMSDGTFKRLLQLNPNDVVKGIDGDLIVKKIIKSPRKNTVYDLVDVGGDRTYFANGASIHNCAFIEGVEDIWLSAQSTISTGGSAILLSTPRGKGNFFHKMWTEAEASLNGFNTIKLKWDLHPERDATWRDEQSRILGEKGSAQECDCDFSSSGDTVIEQSVIDFYKQTSIIEPIERRYVDRNYWIFSYTVPNRQYIISADVARGDGDDFSAFHIIDVETLEQVAEYKGKIPPKEFGNLLVVAGIEYNTAVIVVENLNVGNITIQQLIDRSYPNLFYCSADLQYIDVENQITNKFNKQSNKMVPGFTTTNKNRPLIISKLDSYFREKSLILHSIRLIEELNVFIWNNGKAEAMRGYNDDLVISLGIALWVRDTYFRLNQESLMSQKYIINNINCNTGDTFSGGGVSGGRNRDTGLYTRTSIDNDPWYADGFNLRELL